MLPANVGTGIVHWQAGVAIIDGDDEDQNPDMVYPTGTVTFSPTISHVQNVNAIPNPITIALAPVVGVLDEEGYLCTPVSATDRTPMYRGVRLVATDDPDLSVKNWNYSVAYRLGVVNGATPSIPAHPLAVPEGEDIDLSLFAPVPTSPPVGTPQALALLAKAEEAATLAATNSVAALQVVARADAGEFKGAPGVAGLDGSNVLPTDEGIAQAMATTGSATNTELTATILGTFAGTIIPPNVVASNEIRSVVAVEIGQEPALQDGDLVVRYDRPGTHYFTAFTDVAVGAQPLGWTQPWAAFPGSPPAVQSVPDATGGTAMVWEHGTTTGNRSFTAWNVADMDPARNEVEVLVRIRSRVAGAMLPAIVARASGDNTTATGYRSGMHSATTLSISRYTGGTWSSSVVKPIPAIVADKWYRMKARFEGRDQWFKIWDEAEVEPDWQVFTEDITNSAPGQVGLMYHGLRTRTEVDWLAIATGARKAAP